MIVNEYTFNNATYFTKAIYIADGWDNIGLYKNDSPERPIIAISVNQHSTTAIKILMIENISDEEKHEPSMIEFDLPKGTSKYAIITECFDRIEELNQLIAKAKGHTDFTKLKEAFIDKMKEVVDREDGDIGVDLKKFLVESINSIKPFEIDFLMDLTTFMLEVITDYSEREGE